MGPGSTFSLPAQTSEPASVPLGDKRLRWSWGVKGGPPDPGVFLPQWQQPWTGRQQAWVPVLTGSVTSGEGDFLATSGPQ